MARRIAVAFSNMVEPGWQGGIQYLYNLLVAVKLSNLPMEVVLRIAPGMPAQSYAILNGLFDRIFEFPISLPKWINKMPYSLRRNLEAALSNEDRELTKNHIDVQFALHNPTHGLHTPTITWIPDFQHLHYPDFFSEQELVLRAKIYPASVNNSTLVALSSHHALNDLRRIAPTAVGKVRVLNFVAHVDPEIFKCNPETIAQHYQLPEKFFFLPNQFWQHKNHETVIRALALAKTESPELMVICTGGIYDYRRSEYIDNILQQIAVQGIQGNIRILGRIPREHLWQLMRRAIAVLQPSLFEGWSTSIEEAKSLGKLVIASNIAVHHEQNPDLALYFNPRDPAELAGILLKIHKEKMPGPELDMEQIAKRKLVERQQVFAGIFHKTILELMSLRTQKDD